MNQPLALVKGQNAPVPPGALSVTVGLAAPADLSALLVTPSGKVRKDADFVFFNQPEGPGVRCVQPAPGGAWRIEMNPAALPAEIDQVRVVSNLEQPGARFGQFPPPLVQIATAAGVPVAVYQVSGLDSESIVIVVEFYRRGSDWKVRAVGQGYAGGLADLIADHGVSVDDDGSAAAPSSAPVPPATPVPAATPTPAPPAWGGQQPTPAPPAWGGSPPAGAGAPGSVPPTGAPYGGAPGHLPGPPPVAGAGQGQPEVSLVKGRSVSLTKGQRVSLAKQEGGLTLIQMGLGWDAIQRRSLFGSRAAEVDLDASVIMFADREPLDVVFYNSLVSRDGSVQHMGDNRTGAGDGDDETILIDLPRVSVHVTTLMLIVTSYEGQTFEQVQNAFCRLVDQAGGGGELARFTLAGGMPFTGVAMAKLYREGPGWKLQTIGEGLPARTPLDAVPHLARFL